MSRYRHCFIVTYAKSGSTLLQGALNTLPGYLIRGENKGMVQELQKVVQRADEARQQFSRIGHASTMPWYGIDGIDHASLVRSLGEVFTREFLRPEADTTCVGFKEIRYGPRNVGDLEGLLDFMDEMFEDSCFIFNSRDLTTTATLGKWPERPRSLEYLRKFEARLRAAHAEPRRSSFWVTFDDYVADPAALAPLMDFLGEDFDRARLAAVLAVRHGPRAAQPAG